MAAIDPAAPPPVDRAQAAAVRLAALERRVGVLERAPVKFPVDTAAPTVLGPDGTPFVKTDTNRLYVVTGGVARYVTLT